MPTLRQVSLILISLMLTSCSLFTPIEKPTDKLVLLAPVADTPTRIVKQNVTFEKGLQKKQFIAVIRFTSKQTKLVALLPTGQSFLYLEYDGTRFKEKNEAQIQLPSKDILAMIQFTLWPEKEIKLGYPSELGWHAEVSPNNRRLSYQTKPLLNVELNGKDTVITNYRGDYTVRIHTFKEEVLAP